MSEIDKEIREILIEYLKEDPDERDWKSVVHDIYYLGIDPESCLTTNILEGLSYMDEVAHHMVCNVCADRKVWDWFDRFVEAFVDGKELPEFTHHSCRIGKCKT